MSKHAPESSRWAGILAALFLCLSILVAGGYALIWFDPYLPLNPFPPERADAPPASTATPAPRAASLSGAQPTATFPPTWTPTPTGTATPTRLPSSTPLPTHTPTPSRTPDPLVQYYIAGMVGRRYEGSHVQKQGMFGQNEAYTTYKVSYVSDGIRISGMMNVPQGRGPFPVLILCHGYIPTDRYVTGDGTWRESYYWADRGYITIAPDYRGHAESGGGASFFHVGYAQDVLNLIASLSTVEGADPRRVGVWGHSMGGGVALKAGVVSKTVRAVALFGSVSADEEQNYLNRLGNGPGGLGVSVVGSPRTNLIGYKRMSPLYYLDRSPPLSIHHGKADTTVPYQWSEDLFQAAKREGVKAELYLYPDAGHTLKDEDWELAMERTTAFFDRYVKGG
jgi:fermentation-respiration switch protein FrsA (DUF1100 family)